MRAAEKGQIHTRIDQVAREIGMVPRCIRTHLQHVAENSNAPAIVDGCSRTQQSDRGGHRCGICIVALVNQFQRPVTECDGGALSAPFESRKLRKRIGCSSHILT